MKRRLIILSLVISSLLPGALCVGQVDTISSIKKTPGKTFPYRTVVSLGMIGYGVAAIRSPELNEFNRKVIAELGKPEGRRIFGLDNFLPGIPLAGTYALKLSGVQGEHTIPQTLVIHSVAFVVGNGLVELSKSFKVEWRPDSSNQRSFPSGHTMNAFITAEIMRREFRSVSEWYGIAGYGFAIATGYLRMYNRKHWLNDVLAGAGVGILSSQLAYVVYPAVWKIIKPEIQRGNCIILPFYHSNVAGLLAVIHFK